MSSIAVDAEQTTPFLVGSSPDHRAIAVTRSMSISKVEHGAGAIVGKDIT